MVEPRSERGRARVWLEREVAAMRDAGLPPQRVAQSERVLTAQVGLLLLPLEPYLGLTLAEAEQRAGAEGRRVVDRTGRTDRPRDFQWNRVNVELDADGRVVAADVDGRPWAR